MVTSLAISGWRRVCGAGAPARTGHRYSPFRTGVAALCAAALLVVCGIGGLHAASVKPPVKEADSPQGVYQVQPSSERIDVKVVLHKSETIRIDKPFAEALVGNADVADVMPLTDRSIYIVGRKIGVRGEGKCRW